MNLHSKVNINVSQFKAINPIGSYCHVGAKKSDPFAITDIPLDLISLHDFSNNLQVTQVINVACVEAFADFTSLRLWFIFKTEFLAAQADEQSLRSGLLHSEQ